MITQTKQPVCDIGNNSASPMPEPCCSVSSSELLSELIEQLCEKRARVEALRATLPNEMLPGAVEAFCNLGGKPGAAINGHGVKYLLAETRDKIDRDIDAICSLRRNLPEVFANELAERGLALLVSNFDYRQ